MIFFREIYGIFTLNNTKKRRKITSFFHLYEFMKFNEVVSKTSYREVLRNIRFLP